MKYYIYLKEGSEAARAEYAAAFPAMTNGDPETTDIRIAVFNRGFAGALGRLPGGVTYTLPDELEQAVVALNATDPQAQSTPKYDVDDAGVFYETGEPEEGEEEPEYPDIMFTINGKLYGVDPAQAEAILDAFVDEIAGLLKYDVVGDGHSITLADPTIHVPSEETERA